MKTKHSKTVLFISDNDSIQNKFENIFTRSNLNYCIACSIEESQRIIEREKSFYCVLADLSSPQIFADYKLVQEISISKNLSTIVVCTESDIKIIKRAFKSDSFVFLDITLSEMFLSESIIFFLRLFDIIKVCEENEDALKLSEKNLDLTLRSIGDAVIVTDAKGKLVRMNRVAEKLCGWREHQAVGKDLSEVFVIKSSVTGRIAENPVKKVIEKGHVVGLANHTSLTSKRGDVYQIADSAAPIKDENGHITGVVMVFTDVTKDYALQKKLAENEKKYRDLFKSTSDGVALHDIIYKDGKPIDYIIKDVNPNYPKFTGISVKKAIGKKGSELYRSPDGKAPYLKEFTSVDGGGKPIRFETFFPPLGRYFSISVFSPESGKFATVFQDITKRKIAEKALKESEEQFKNLIKNYPAGIIVLYDKEYRYILVEGQGLKASGLSKKMLQGKKISEVFTEVFFRKIKPHIDGAFKGHKKTFEVEWNNKIFAQTVIPMKRNGAIESVMGVITNITSRKRAEIEAKQAEKRVKAQRLATTKIVLHESVVKDNLDSALEFILRTAGNTLETSRASIWLFNNDNSKLVCKSLFDVDKKKYSSGNVLDANSYPDYFNAILTQNRINVDNAASDPRTSEFKESYLVPLDIKSMLDAGIIREGKTIGVICFEQQHQTREWRSDEESFASTIAAIVSQVFANLERKRAEEQLVAAKEKAEQSDKLKTLFLQNISHEIRTPLNGIIGFCSLLKDFKDIQEEERNNYVNMILYSSERLLGVVTDIIDMAKIDSGVSRLNETEIDLKIFFNYFKEMLIQGAESKNIQAEVSVTPEVNSMTIISDKDKLSQVITNLINNAVKFTDKGFVKLIVKPVKRGLEICVKDSGVGIEKKYFDMIFERFWQHESFRKSNYGGTGLGLSITRGLTKSLGMSISLKSKIGHGSSFTIVVPSDKIIINAKRGNRSIKKSKFNSKVTGKFRVLIVEDDAINNYYLLKIFNKAKISTDTAENGKVAVQLARENKYNLILMDIKMPIMDGIKASRLIKQMHPETIIVAQSAYTQPEEKQLAFEASCDEFVQKPLKRQQIISLIQKYLPQK
jgi:PAS domain S-box-containing protein